MGQLIPDPGTLIDVFAKADAMQPHTTAPHPSGNGTQRASSRGMKLHRLGSGLYDYNYAGKTYMIELGDKETNFEGWWVIHYPNGAISDEFHTLKEARASLAATLGIE